MESNSFLSKEEQKPLVTCQHCKDRPCIKTGKICDVVESLLPKPRSGGHKKEGTRSNDQLDHFTSEATRVDVWRPSLYGTKKTGEGKITLTRKYKKD